jgi:nitronate monooxygenase
VPRATATELLKIDHPVVQAGMATGYTNSELVAAVSEAGGLGVLGCLNRSTPDAALEIARIRAATDRPFGVNFVVEHLDHEVFEACLAARVPIFTFFRGAPELVVERAQDVGAVVVYQVTTVPEADAALRAGADVLVAQGREAGGHVGPIPLREILPAVVAMASDVPVLAAGGIVDGPSLRDAMSLGASGGWVGTRFLATVESPASPAHKRAILEAGARDTVRSGIWDLIWGRAWPGVEVRVIRNAVTERWIGREDEIPVHRDEINAALATAISRDDAAEMDLLAGEGAAHISTLTHAGDVVRTVASGVMERSSRLSRNLRVSGAIAAHDE